MGRLFLIDLDHRNIAPLKPYFICLSCQNHIGFVDYDTPWVEGTWHPLQVEKTVESLQCLNSVVNVYADDDPARYKDFVITTDFGVPHPDLPFRDVSGRWADAHCVQCNKFLGHNIVEVANDEDLGLVGQYVLILTKLLKKTEDGGLIPAEDIEDW